MGNVGLAILMILSALAAVAALCAAAEVAIALLCLALAAALTWSLAEVRDRDALTALHDQRLLWQLGRAVEEEELEKALAILARRDGDADGEMDAAVKADLAGKEIAELKRQVEPATGPDVRPSWPWWNDG